MIGRCSLIRRGPDLAASVALFAAGEGGRGSRRVRIQSPFLAAVPRGAAPPTPPPQDGGSTTALRSAPCREGAQRFRPLHPPSDPLIIKEAFLETLENGFVNIKGGNGFLLALQSVPPFETATEQNRASMLLQQECLHKPSLLPSSEEDQWSGTQLQRHVWRSSDEVHPKKLLISSNLQIAVQRLLLSPQAQAEGQLDRFNTWFN